MSDCFYYEENDKLYRIRIERDDTPWNPREEDGHVGTMICAKRSGLGDEQVDIVAYIDDLLRTHVKENTIINYVKKGKASSYLALKYDRHEREWQLWGITRRFINAPDKYRQYVDVPSVIADTDQTVDWLIDDVIDALSLRDKLTLLERKGFYFLPLAVYEHSGITMWVGSKWGAPCDAEWDASDVGFIYTTKERIQECNKFDDWKKLADEWMRAEVEEYDNYLKGDVYGYWLDRYDALNDEWNEDIESCWGFNSSKWGEELAREIANSDITGQPFISEADAEIAMANLHQIALDEEHERKIMDQADYMVCI